MINSLWKCFLMLCLTWSVAFSSDYIIQSYSPKDFGTAYTGFLDNSESSSVWVNPSLLSLSKGVTVSLSHSFYLLQSQIDNLSCAVPVNNRFVVGTGFQLSTIPFTKIENSLTTPYKDYAHFFLLSGGVGFSLNKNWRFGGTAFVHRQKLDDGYIGTAVAITFSSTYISKIRKIYFPIIIDKVGINSAFSVKTGLHLPFRLGDYGFFVNIGFGYNFAYYYFEFSNSYEYILKPAINKELVFRLGINSCFSTKPFLFAGGVSYRYKNIRGDVSINVDSNLKSSWILGFIYYR